MKICILTPRFPFPENGGDVLRINHIAGYLKSQGHELILLSFCEGVIPEGVRKDAEALYDTIYSVKRNKLSSFLYSFLYFVSGKPIQCGYYHSGKYMRSLKRIAMNHHPDLFISHLLRMSPYLERLGVVNKSIVEMTDALSKTYGMASKSKWNLKKVIYSLEKNLICKYEHHVIRTFPKTVLVSADDINFLATKGARNICLHTNGVEVYENPQTSYDKNKICFIGNMRTLQNQDAVLFFINDIFPRIQSYNPEVKLYIVGAQPPEKIRALASNNIIVTGFVKDLSPVISDACLSVAPVRIASGIQNKVLVAMGHKIPVVMTSLIAGAIPELKDHENCRICDDAGAFANACISFMQDRQVRDAIAGKGYDMVREAYSWDNRLKGYEIIPA